jgi:hypothetical protein
MRTLPVPSPTVNKAFYAHLYDEAGALTKVNDVIYFLADAGEITVIEPPDCTFLTVLGEIGVCDTQKMVDRLAGGFAAIACQRQMQVA